MSDPIMRIFETKSRRLRSISRFMDPLGYVMSMLPCFVRKNTHADRHKDRRAWPAKPTRTCSYC